jgi:antitoxin MazE
MQVARWGNSLAIRIPAKVAHEMNLKEGDVVNIVKATADTLALEDRDTLIARIRKLAKPLPPGWKFDREEANTRGPYPPDSSE